MRPSSAFGLALGIAAGCGSNDASDSNAAGGTSDSGGVDAASGASGSAGGGVSGSSGAGNFAGQSGSDAGSAADASSPSCSVLLEIPGLAHISTPAEPKKIVPIAQSAPTSWQSMRVELDVYHAGWSPKQGQYEVFTLLRGNKWVGNAIGYIAIVGPGSRKTVMVANLNLPYAAAPDGRRITKSYPYAPDVTYHLDYVYDVPADLRELVVSVAGAEVTRVTGQVSVPTADPPVTSIDVPKLGFTFLMGGAETADGPDAATYDWEFSNVKITGCQ